MVGVGASKVQLAPMQSFEIMRIAGHGGTGSAMFLEESNISTPLGKALSKRSEASDVLGLHDGNARTDSNGGRGIGQGLNKIRSSTVILGRGRRGARCHSRLGAQPSKESLDPLTTRARLMLNPSGPKPGFEVERQHAGQAGGI